MKILPDGFQDHLDTGTTTLCWCWKLTRADGVVFGFTDHDRDLSFDSVLYEAATGFSASEIQDRVGLAVSNLDVQGALQSTRLNEDDLAAGLFDNATVELYRVNWGDVAQRVLMRKGSIGEVRRSEHLFTAEVRGLAHELQQPMGRIFQYGCDADLGNSRCGVDLEVGAYKGTGVVSNVSGKTIFEVTGLSGFADDWFSGGKLTWTTGSNAGLSMEVKLHTVSVVVTIELWHGMAQPVLVADQFDIQAGCNKLFETCKSKFSNGVNFRGFPHMPGNDFVASYPNSDDSNLDGGSMNL